MFELLLHPSRSDKRLANKTRDFDDIFFTLPPDLSMSSSPSSSTDRLANRARTPLSSSSCPSSSSDR
ncbi:unnamed protein product [Linum trigynum]|uniref:Uncharacterized protein n=1 Tax=Linum trigynum TaxID=586398 RepID=A0AAV2FN15_9ROSI